MQYYELAAETKDGVTRIGRAVWVKERILALSVSFNARFGGLVRVFPHKTNHYSVGLIVECNNDIDIKSPQISGALRNLVAGINEKLTTVNCRRISAFKARMRRSRASRNGYTPDISNVSNTNYSEFNSAAPPVKLQGIMELQESRVCALHLDEDIGVGKMPGYPGDSGGYGLATPDILTAITDAEAELAAMIGLDEAKQLCTQILDYFEVSSKYPKENAKTERCKNMCLIGNPGTAKTTFARLIGRILYSRGVTKSPEVIEVSRADIVGQYTGWSAKLTAKAFDRAKDAILFIDEAYSLVEDHNSFGQEVINQLVREMDNRHDVIVILAGYPDKMEEFLCKNPGLRSRIRWTVNFPDYTEEELFLIAQHIASRYGYKLADDVKGKIMPMIAEAKKSHEFGNGRWCRKLVENSELRWSARVKRMDDNEITTDVLDTLIAGDFVRPSDLKTEHRTIGFVVS